MLLFKLAEATHIVGGEMYYDNLGGNTYKLHMKVYRDCINGSPFAPFEGFPNPNGVITPAVFTVFDASGTVIQTGIFTPLGLSSVPPTNNSPCAPVASGNACVEEAIYETTINLPPLAGGYYIAYQRCCRNGTILNLINPGAVGATYWTHIPGPEVVAVNSSPRFTYRPPIYICNELPIAFDHVATDPDGDSLVYTMCTPFDGLSSGCPVIDLTGNNGCPLTNEPPPYLGVPFDAGYSSSYPMASNPAINIDPVTGFLDGNPSLQGQWVVGVCVEEFRNGQLIGTHHRDFQFNVIPCPFIVNADIISQTGTNNGQGTGFCNGFTISYSNASTGNLISYHWDFGDTLTLADTSNIKNPNYTFTTPGIYTVTLIVNPGNPCADTTYEVFHVFPLLSPDYILPVSQCFTGNSFNFAGTGQFQGNGTFNWDFGSGASPPTANTLSVTGVHYNAPGSYPVTFTVSENGCTAVTTKTINVYQSPEAVIGNFITGGCVPLTVTFPNLSTSGTPMAYTWAFSDGTTSTATSPVKTFTAPGVYSVSLTVITNQQCIDTSQVTAVNTITVVPVPVAQFNIAPATVQCLNNNLFNFTNNSVTTGGANYTWNFDSHASVQTSTLTNQSVSYNNSGQHIASLTVSEAGCTNTFTQAVTVYDNPVAVIGTFPNSGCTPFTVNFSNQSTAGNPMTYQWSFSDGTNSVAQNPVKVFSNEGVYSFTLTATTATGCVSSSSLSSVNSITVTETPVAAFTYVSATGQCFDNNHFDFINNGVFFGSVIHSWSFGPAATPINSTNFNVPNVLYSAPGIYTVTLTENKNGCIDTETKLVELYENPVADLGIFPVTGCDPFTVNFNSTSTAASPISYLWTFDNGITSTSPNPTHVFSPPGTYQVSLTISTTSKCIANSSSASLITVNPVPTAGFSVITDNQSYVQCTNEASADVISWHYNFDDGKSSTAINPLHNYSNVDVYDIIQTVTNAYGCKDTYTLPVVYIPEFAFWIPNAFTPGNKDGMNDVFKPKVFGVEDYTFSVFNRWGEMIYETHDLNAGWDGTYKGAPSPMDVYVWKCDFKNNTSRQNEYHVGHVTLVR